MLSSEGKGSDFHDKQNRTQSEILLFPGYWPLATDYWHLLIFHTFFMKNQG